MNRMRRVDQQQRRNFEKKSRISYENRRNRFFNFRYFFSCNFSSFSVLWARKIRKRNRQSRDEKERKVSAELSFSQLTNLARPPSVVFDIFKCEDPYARENLLAKIFQKKKSFFISYNLIFFSLSPHKNILYFPLIHPKRKWKSVDFPPFKDTCKPDCTSERD